MVVHGARSVNKIRKYEFYKITTSTVCVCVCVCAWGAGIQAGTTIPDHNGRKCERGSCSSQAFQDPFKEENQGYQLTSDFSLYKLLHMQVAQVTTKKTEIGYESSRLVGAGNE